MAGVTLRAVAERAEVSVSLVSKVISGKMGNSTVSPEKAKRILEIANEMGYVPDVNARRLRMGRGNTIAAVFPFGSRYYESVYYRFMEGILAVAQDASYDFVSLFYNWDGKELENLRQLRKMPIDGLIYCPSFQAAESEDCQTLLRQIIQSGTPTLISLNAYPKAEGAYYMTVDDFEGGYLAVKHCVDKGYKNVVFIENSVELRREGSHKAIRELGAGCEWKVLSDYRLFEREAGYRCFNEAIWSPSGELPDAIIATCDINALGILDAMQEKGIPQDAGEIIGYDGLDVISITGRHFTSIVQPTYQMGRDAANKMIRWIETGEMEDQVYSPYVGVL